MAKRPQRHYSISVVEKGRASVETFLKLLMREYKVGTIGRLDSESEDSSMARQKDH